MSPPLVYFLPLPAPLSLGSPPVQLLTYSDFCFSILSSLDPYPQPLSTFKPLGFVWLIAAWHLEDLIRQALVGADPNPDPVLMHSLTFGLPSQITHRLHLTWGDPA